MSNNDALSQPIAYTDREELESMQGPDGDTYAAMWSIPHGCGQDIALYSQGYVNALIQRAEAAEQRLQQPIKLPLAEGEAKQAYLDKVIEVLNGAGVQIRYNCPRCNSLLDLTCRPDGDHYCHNQARLGE
ncbi:hypothetical protein [Serratia fonticola]